MALLYFIFLLLLLASKGAWSFLIWYEAGGGGDSRQHMQVGQAVGEEEVMRTSTCLTLRFGKDWIRKDQLTICLYTMLCISQANAQLCLHGATIKDNTPNRLFICNVLNCYYQPTIKSNQTHIVETVKASNWEESGEVLFRDCCQKCQLRICSPICVYVVQRVIVSAKRSWTKSQGRCQ